MPKGDQRHPDPPEETEEEKQRRFALTGLNGALVDLATNLLRVVRGAGQPYAVLRDCQRVVAALREFGERTDGDGPTEFEISSRLAFQVPDRASKKSRERDLALHQMSRGALQFVASTMLSQTPQTRSGEYEMIDGARRFSKFTALEDERRQERYKADLKAMRQAKGPRRPKKPAPGR